MFSIGKFSKEIGVSTTTLRTWHKNNILIPQVITTGWTRYYSKEQLYAYKNETNKKESRFIYIYSRVSNSGQKDDLMNQQEFLQVYCNAKGYIVKDVVSDIGSGLNYNRKNWNRLLEEIQNKNVEKVIVAHKDRFIRFGYDWFEKFCLKFGCEIEVVNNEKLNPQEEMVQDLISIIHVFSCIIYGLRKYKKKIELDESI